MLKKAWIIEDGIRYLLKGGYKNELLQPFNEIIKVVKDLKRIDISKLDGIVEWFDELLHKYQHLTKFSDAIINRLCIILNRKINKLKNLIEE